MTKLDLAEREMLESLRAELDPQVADRRRVSELLTVRLGLSALHSVPPQVANSGLGTAVAKGGGTASFGATVKLGVVGVLLIGAGVVGVVATSQQTSEPEAPPVALAVPQPARVVPRPEAPAVAPADHELPRVESRELETEVVPAPRKPKLNQGSNLDEELRLLREAHRYNAQNQPQAALRIVQQLTARFPKGRLQEERQAVRAIALCKLGGSSGVEEAKRFVARHPTSVYGGRVKAACR